jgi:MFS family permease
MNELQTLEASGFSLPSPAYLFGAILFSIFGYAAWRYGRKLDKPNTQWLGAALMVYSYLFSETWQIYAVGSSLCIALYLFRK